MDASPVPRCNLKSFLVILCLVLAIFMIAEINISTYENIKDSNCLNFTSISEYEDIGIAYKVGIISIPICCCAFFALKLRGKKSNTKYIAPPSCRYAKILNC